jgi:hypothetical protein
MAPSQGAHSVDGKRSSQLLMSIDGDNKWNAAKNLQSLTGGLAPTILAGYFTHR